MALFYSIPSDPEVSEDDICDFEESIDPVLTGKELDEELPDESEPCTSRKRKGNDGLNKKSRKRRRKKREIIQENSDEFRQIEEDYEWSCNIPGDICTPKTCSPTFASCINFGTKPVDIFSLYFDDEVMQNIVDQTNVYAEQMQRPNWVKTTLTEIKAFLGMLVLMSVNPMHQFYLYWSSDPFFNVPEISKVMSHSRFSQLVNCIHLNDNAKIPKFGTENYDRLYKLRPLIEKLNENFSKCYTPSGCLAIDESMVLFKGRSSMKQYMPMKPKIKRGFKIWSLADSANGYLIKFSVYQGKDESRPKSLTLGEHVVLSLIENSVVPGTQVYFDNYFTSTKLLENLREKGIYSCGTFRSDRKNLPNIMKTNNKLERGEHVWRSKGSVSAIQWRDTKNVHIMTNFHDPTKITEVQRKLANGTKIFVQCPQAISDYNIYMNAVDKFDQKRNAYILDKRSKKWWLRLFYFMVDAAIVNSFIQYSSKCDITYLSFRLALGRQLIAGGSFRKKRSTSWQAHKLGKKSSHGMISVPNEIRYEGNEHHPIKNVSRRRCRWCSTTKKEKRTAYMCKLCQVPLCVECFASFHK